MYSDVLALMDRNTERYMMDKKLKEMKKEMKKEMQRVISEKDAIIQDLLAQLAQLENTEAPK